MKLSLNLRLRDGTEQIRGGRQYSYSSLRRLFAIAIELGERIEGVTDKRSLLEKLVGVWAGLDPRWSVVVLAKLRRDRDPSL